MAENNFKVIRHIGDIAKFRTGWTREINLLSWNDGPERYDIRDWSDNHRMCSRGVSLTAEEMKALIFIMEEELKDPSEE